MHGNPKVLEDPALALAGRIKDENSVEQNDLAAYVMLKEEAQRVSQKMIAEAEQQRVALIEAAGAQVDEMLAAARQEAERLKSEAYETGKDSGYKEGYEHGCDSAREQMRQAVHEANQKAEHTIRLAENELKDIVSNAEKKILELSMAIVQKVLPQHFIDVPQIVLPLIKSALEKVKDQNSIVLRVAPEDYEMTLMARNEFQMMIEGEERIMITEDQTLQRGGCVIETANGNVDARLSTQLELLKKAMQEV